jgi:hypothetical protein
VQPHMRPHIAESIVKEATTTAMAMSMAEMFALSTVFRQQGKVSYRESSDIGYAESPLFARL